MNDCARCEKEITGFYLEYPREIQGRRICIICYQEYETKRLALESDYLKSVKDFQTDFVKSKSETISLSKLELSTDPDMPEIIELEIQVPPAPPPQELAVLPLSNEVFG